jgi:hypothetical protein
LPADAPWRVFTKRLAAQAALARFPSIRIQGDRQLAERVLEMVSIVA